MSEYTDFKMFRVYDQPHLAPSCATDSWVLICTTPYSIKLEFRVISDILDGCNKYSQRALLNPIFPLLTEMIF